MKTLLRMIGILLVSSSAYALNYGLELGFRQQSAASPTGSSAVSQNGIQGGVTGAFDLSSPLSLRLGFLYTQRPQIFKNDTTNSETKVSMNYFDIPVALMYQIEEYAGVYGGVVAGLNLDSSCDTSGCKANEVKSLLMPIQIGANFKFAPQMGATVYYETSSGDAAKLNGTGIGGYKAVGVNLMITFD